MVEVTFGTRAAHFVSLHLLKRIASSSEVPEDIDYIGKDGVEAIQGVSFSHRVRIHSHGPTAMALINRGRLSVQPVDEKTWDAIVKLADTGGWNDNFAKASKGTKKLVKKADVNDDGDDEEAGGSEKRNASKTSSKKRKAPVDNVQTERNVRRSTRLKT